MLSASIVVMTYNRKYVLKKTVEAMLGQDFESLFEIIVVNDGSMDGTKEMLEKNFGKNKKLTVINEERSLPCKARNNGIKAAKNDVVVIMDDDCIPEKKWLSKIVNGFDDKKTGIVTSYSRFGGTSTAFRRETLDKIGGYDEEYGYYREDTDLVFRVMEKGFEARFVDAGFVHEHEIEKPKGLLGLAWYALERAKYHKNDVLLYKKHPRLAKGFLGVKLGFLVDPRMDFAAATGTWHAGGKINLSSPRGITFLQNKTPFHGVIIIAGAIGWVFLVKFFRLTASLRFGKLLI
ncbi:MAG: glycosyltransferase family A protein [archaeon]|nr:glycosyltransferase family A protein [archaeon]